MIPESTINVTIVRNALTGAREQSCEMWFPDNRVYDYVPAELRDCNLRIIINDQPFEKADAFPQTLAPGNTLFIEAVPTDPVTGTAIAVYALSKNPAAFLKGVVGAGLALTGIPVISQLGMGLVGASASEFLTGEFSSKTKATKKNSNDTYSSSPTYSLNGLSNTVQNGLPIPFVYGKHRIGGQVINQFYRVNDQGQSTLFTLIALEGHGQFSSICGFTTDQDSITGGNIPSTLELNGNPATNFGSGLRLSIRMGTFNQNPLPQFNNLTTTQTVGSDLSPSSPITYTTTAPVSAFEVNIQHPGGLYKIQSSTGKPLAYTVTYQIRWRETGGSSWFGTQTKTVEKLNQAEFASAVRVDAPLGYNSDGSPVERILDIEVTRTSSADNSFQFSTIKFDSVNEILGGDFSYPGTALIGVEALGTDQLQGGINVITAEVEGRKVLVWDGVSTTSPTFVYKYDDNTPTKEEDDYESTLWQALRANAGTNDAVGFQFYTLSARTLTSVNVRLRRSSATATVSGNCYVEIQSDNGSGQPSGTVLATSESRNIATVKAATGEVYAFAFASPLALSAGVPYHAVIQGTYTVSATNHIQIGLIPVTGGDYDLEIKGGASWSDSSVYRVAATTHFRGRRPGENPAWWTLDFMLSDAGLGPYVKVNDIAPYLSEFSAWADYCDETYETYNSTVKSLPGPRWAGGFVIDIETSAWELALKLAQVGNATLVPFGAGIRPVVNKPASVTQLFTDGNIVKDSFKIGHMGLKDRYNRFEMQYSNEEIGYNKDIAIVEASTIQSAGDTVRVEKGNVFGLTAPWRARMAARVQERAATLIKRTYQWRAPIDAIACEVGDVVKVVHPLNTTESITSPSVNAADCFGGRVVAATSTTIDIDRLATEPASAPYITRIVVRTTASGVESIQEREVTAFADYTTNTNQTFSRLTIDPAWTTTPSAGDVFGYLGAGTNDGRMVRVLGFGLAESGEVSIVGFNYTTSQFDHDIGNVEEFTDTLPIPQRIPDAVENLKLTESHTENPDGSLYSTINVSFEKPKFDAWAEIFWRISGDNNWTYSGRTEGEFYQIPNVSAGDTYQVAVRVASSTQARQSLDSCPSATLYILGPFAPPAAPTNLVAVQNDEHVYLSWSAGTPASAILAEGSSSAPGRVAGYQIRRGKNWATGMIVTDGVLGTAYLAPGVGNGYTATFWVASYNSAGVFCTSPASVSITGGEDWREDVSDADEAPSWGGTKTNCSVTGGVLYCDGASATYETAVIDTGADRYYHLDIEAGFLPNDPQDLVSESTYLVGSTQAERRLVIGWQQSPLDRDVVLISDGTEEVGSWYGRYLTVGGAVDLTNRTSALIEWKSSPDNITYTDYREFIPGNVPIEDRYFRVKLTMTGDANSLSGGAVQRIALDSLKIRLSRANVIWKTIVVTSTGGSTTITYPFTIPTAATPTGGIRLAAGGDALAFSAVGTTSLNVDIYNSAGSRVAKTAYVHIIG